MKTAALSLDQAPPLALPASFFVLAPVALGGAGLLLLRHGAGALTSPWLPATLGLTHLGTLGLLGSVMLGALYQMCPVVAGQRVPLPGLARAVCGAWVVGVSALVVGLGLGWPAAVRFALALLGAALLGFVGPVGVALARSSHRDATVAGMRLALAGLLAVGGVGVFVAWGHATGHFLGPRPLWVRGHLVLGLVVWVGGLLTAVSWQVVPMFYLGQPVSPWARWAVGGSVAVSGVGVLAALAVGSADAVVGAAVPGVLGIGVAHPLLTLRSLALRRRRRVDPSARAWQGGLVCGLVAAGLVAPAHLAADPRWALAMGWLVVLGWAGGILHGVLLRIVPFLVWFHRYSPLVGLRDDVPAMRDLLEPRRVQIGLGLHGGAVIAGLATIATGLDPVAWATGALLLATGSWLAVSLVLVLGSRPGPP